jgi:hypothetical protein
MLERVEREVRVPGDLETGRDDAEDTALIARAIAVFQRGRSRQEEPVVAGTTGPVRLARRPEGNRHFRKAGASSGFWAASAWPAKKLVVTVRFAGNNVLKPTTRNVTIRMKR